MADHFDRDWQQVPPNEEECDEAAQYEEHFQGSSEEIPMTSFHRMDVFNSVIEFSENQPPKRISVGQLEINSAGFEEHLMLLRSLANATDRLQSDLDFM
ncbi:hypothetical protein MTO96_026404 [Rhipicephalus appendiculatus]